MKKKLLLLLASIVLVIIVAQWPRSVTTKPCRITALDVGQGDALLIRTPDNQDVLVDGGPSGSVVQELGKALPIGDRDIELMVLTHPHADHVNGLISVTERYDVSSALLTGVPFRQTAYTTWRERLDEDQATEYFAHAGQTYDIGKFLQIEILWPPEDLRDNPIDVDHADQGGGVNDSSIIFRATCAGSTAMFTGDASAEIEEKVLAQHNNVQSSLLKVGHHGSRFSTGRAWLDAVQPKLAVISAGIGNRYHHPHPTTLQRLDLFHIPTYRTDELGTVTFESDTRGSWNIRK